MHHKKQSLVINVVSRKKEENVTEVGNTGLDFTILVKGAKLRVLFGKDMHTSINNNKKLHCSLSLCEILEVVFFFVMEIPMNTAVTVTENSSSTITDWCSVCQEV